MGEDVKIKICSANDVRSGIRRMGRKKFFSLDFSFSWLFIPKKIKRRRFEMRPSLEISKVIRQQSQSVPDIDNSSSLSGPSYCQTKARKNSQSYKKARRRHLTRCFGLCYKSNFGRNVLGMLQRFKNEQQCLRILKCLRGIRVTQDCQQPFKNK